MRIFIQIKHVDIVKLDVEVLVDRFQRAANANIVFEFDSDNVVRECLEEAVIQDKLEPKKISNFDSAIEREKRSMRT